MTHTRLLPPGVTVFERGWLSANNILFYGTGGFGFGGVDMTRTGGLSGSNTRTGWTGGAGVEYGIDRNWSVKAEAIKPAGMAKIPIPSKARTTVSARPMGVMGEMSP